LRWHDPCGALRSVATRIPSEEHSGHNQVTSRSLDRWADRAVPRRIGVVAGGAAGEVDAATPRQIARIGPRRSLGRHERRRCARDASRSHHGVPAHSSWSEHPRPIRNLCGAGAGESHQQSPSKYDHQMSHSQGSLLSLPQTLQQGACRANGSSEVREDQGMRPGRLPPASTNVSMGSTILSSCGLSSRSTRRGRWSITSGRSYSGAEARKRPPAAPIRLLHRPGGACVR